VLLQLLFYHIFDVIFLNKQIYIYISLFKESIFNNNMIAEMSSDNRCAKLKPIS